jgi:hypothetical protein
VRCRSFSPNLVLLKKKKRIKRVRSDERGVRRKARRSRNKRLKPTFWKRACEAVLVLVFLLRLFREYVFCYCYLLVNTCTWNYREKLTSVTAPDSSSLRLSLLTYVVIEV